jgi:hypothetical protein
MDGNCSTLLEDVVATGPLLSAEAIGLAKAYITKVLAKQAKLHFSIITRGGTHNGDDHGAPLKLVAGSISLM